jgi:prepilin-type N-terminal cleavage/methylation domain-containing protein
MSRTRTSQRGFTLPELLTVTAVLAALAALLLPVLAAARERARRATCLAHLRQIAQAQRLYLQDWDERFVHWHVPAPRRPRPFGPRSYGTEFLRPYLRTDAMLRDPSAPSLGQEENRLADYALVTWGPGGQGTPEQPYFFWPGPPLSLGQVVRPSQTIQVTDGRTTTFGVQIDALSPSRVDGQIRGTVTGGEATSSSSTGMPAGCSRTRRSG